MSGIIGDYKKADNFAIGDLENELKPKRRLESI